MYDRKRAVADLLNEEAETRSIRERLRQKQQSQTQQQRKPKRHKQERLFLRECILNDGLPLFYFTQEK